MITAGFIGLGLIGGSIARAFKKNCPGIHITAYNRSPEPLARAVSDGIVDTPVHEVGNEFGDCDIIFCVHRLNIILHTFHFLRI